jgi:hypothetical protein
MFEPLEALNPLLSGKPGAAGGAFLGGVNRAVVSGELGLLLAVPGPPRARQYDLALLGKEPVAAGKLYFVEPNIRMVEEQLGLPRRTSGCGWRSTRRPTPSSSRPTLAAAPLQRLLERYFGLLRDDAEHLRHAGVKGLGLFVDRVRTADHGGGAGWRR